MEGYLGETIVDIKDTEFKDYTKSDWAMYFIEVYGQIDGSHHKAWVLDQIARILKGTKIIIKLAKWENGQFEYRIILNEPSNEYLNWIKEIKGEIIEDEDYVGYEYDYDEGIAP